MTTPTSAQCSSPWNDNVLLKISLDNVSNPRVTRTLSCPADVPFHQLHNAIIISFGWALTHLYGFEASTEQERGFLAPPASLEISEERPEHLELSALNNAQQPWKSSKMMKLDQYMGHAAYKDHFLKYIYDFGDNWVHSLTYIGRAPKTTQFVCIDGEGHGCAEDVGGPSGWDELKEAYRSPSPNETQEEVKDWYEKHATNGFFTGLAGERLWR